MDILNPFELCLADVFPPGVNLTGNEVKVLIVLKAACVGYSNVAAIDQEKIAELSNVPQPHVARAIRGLRQKGMLLKTWMEAGSKMYRNIYALWVPPEIIERDAKRMMKQCEEAQKLERQAEEEEQKAIPYLQKADAKRQQAHVIRKTVCSLCYGEGKALVYIPSEKREQWRVCMCSTGRRVASELGLKAGQFVPENIKIG